jgi:hypothetical protein
MNLKVKSSLIIIVTLIIGIVLGIIITQSFFRPPRIIDRIAELRSPEGFMDKFEKIINPDESQKEKIRYILQNHFEKMHNQSLEFRDRFKNLNDSLRADLNPILNDEQKERLDKMTERFRQHERDGFGPRPPHPQRKYPKGREKKQQN